MAKRGVAISTAGAFPDNPEPFDCVAEDCVIDEPYANNVRETVCIELAGGENADGVMGYHRGCVVRNCLINCIYSDREIPIAYFFLSGSDALGATKGSHGRAVDDWACITGALINDSAANTYNGSYKLISGTGGNQIKYALASPVPTVEPSGEIFIGRAPSHRVAIDSITEVTTDTKWELITKTPHNRLPGQKVRLNNVQGGSGVFNGAFAIVDAVPSTLTPVKVRFNLSTSTTPSLNNAYIGVDSYGIVVNGGRSIILENNRILNTTFGVYHDTGSTKDALIRDNYFYNVLSAIYFKLGQVSAGDSNQQPTRSSVSISRGGTGNLTATFVTSAAHGLSIGQAVAVSGANQSAYNGVFPIASVPNPTSFTYLMSSDPGATASGSFKFGALWQVGRLIIENNIIELILPITGTPDAPTAIRLERKASTPAAPMLPYVFQQAFIRSNVIRHSDNASDTSAVSLALQLNSCASAIIEDNVVRLDRATPIEFSGCEKVKFFNNQSTDGKLIQGFKADAGATQLLNELETDVDLGLVSVI